MTLKNQNKFRLEFIGPFVKTEHFLLRQWDRKVPNELLLFTLNQVSPKKGKRHIIVSRSIVKNFDTRKIEFFIVIKDDRLITCFFSEMKTFLGKKNSNIAYELVSVCQKSKN